MRLDAAIVAYVPWLGGTLPVRRRVGLQQSGKPVLDARNADRPLAVRRAALGLTQVAVAERLLVSARSIARLEARPPFARSDARVKRLRARVTGLYRYLEGSKA